VTEGEAEDFEYDFDTHSSDILTELVPNLENWAGIGWMELEEYEYHAATQTMNLLVETKWASPTEWLRNASLGSVYFENKLITMVTIQKDEACVTGFCAMDGEVLQHKNIFEMEPEEVGKYYNDDQPNYDLDHLDNQIWDSIGQFINVCTQFYQTESDNYNE
jgi:hypothetical protein